MRYGLDARFISLLALTVLANMGVGVVMPVLPLYFQQYEVTIVGLSAPFATLVMGRLLSRALAPRLIAALGHRYLVTTSFVLYTAVFVAYLGATTIYQFAALRFIEGIIEGVLAVALNDLAIAYTRGAATELRVRAMGRFGAAFGLGFLLGPLVGSVAAYLWGLQAVFVASAVLGTGAVVLAARHIVDAPAGADTPAAQLSGLADMGLLIGIYSPQCLRRLVFFALMILLPLHAGDHLGLAPETVGVFFALSAMITTAVMPFAGVFARRLGPDRLVGTGLLVMGLALLLLGTQRTLGAFSGLFLIETLAFALMLPPAMSVFGDVVDDQARRTQILGAMAFMTETVSLPLALVLPACYAIGPEFAWGTVASLAFASAAAFAISRRRLGQRARRGERAERLRTAS